MVDTHCHLDFCEPPDAELIERARAAGVRRLATVGTNPASIERALGAASAHEGVAAVVGRHPHESEGFGEADLALIEDAAEEAGTCAIGETGLDFYRDRAPRGDQLRAFEAQLALAERAGLPVVIHTRAAEEETFAVLREHAEGLTVVLHCFSAAGRLAECVDRGYFCSFAGNVTYPKGGELQAAAREVPEDLLLLETDSPYLAPQALRGRPNEPANVVSTAAHVAALRGVSYDELEFAVERNAERAFRW